MTVTDAYDATIAQKLIHELHEYVTSQLTTVHLLKPTKRLQRLLNEAQSLLIATKLFNEYITYTQTKQLFHRLLLPPGITEEQLVQFMLPIRTLAQHLPDIELVVFFDEFSTSSCLGLFHEMFIDRTIHGQPLADKIFFTAAINPYISVANANSNNKNNDDSIAHRLDYLVHQLSQSLEHLKCRYGTLSNSQLHDHIKQKIQMFQKNENKQQQMPLDSYVQETVCDAILNAQDV
ncbi:unnamed protein product [Didymodactylos carnosus]|uniref:Uncharacterized protein n=1 Tax=Didymodactylos carnosus TaxID=1234261 RepID=A0A816BHR1_9BILA|nr:unnamed protein product [Didymodactylos carnosus]CAF4493890.1 unnamed protein product [Didymodactylos carnosus]